MQADALDPVLAQLTEAQARAVQPSMLDIRTFMPLDKVLIPSAVPASDRESYFSSLSKGELIRFIEEIMDLPQMADVPILPNTDERTLKSVRRARSAYAKEMAADEALSTANATSAVSQLPIHLTTILPSTSGVAYDDHAILDQPPTYPSSMQMLGHDEIPMDGPALHTVTQSLLQDMMSLEASSQPFTQLPSVQSGNGARHPELSTAHESFLSDPLSVHPLGVTDSVAPPIAADHSKSPAEILDSVGGSYMAPAVPATSENDARLPEHLDQSYDTADGGREGHTVGSDQVWYKFMSL